MRRCSVCVCVCGECPRDFFIGSTWRNSTFSSLFDLLYDRSCLSAPSHLYSALFSPSSIFCPFFGALFPSLLRVHVAIALHASFSLTVKILTHAHAQISHSNSSNTGNSNAVTYSCLLLFKKNSFWCFVFRVGCATLPQRKKARERQVALRACLHTGALDNKERHPYVSLS